jgi:hypothetical protein
MDKVLLHWYVKIIYNFPSFISVANLPKFPPRNAIPRSALLSFGCRYARDLIPPSVYKEPCRITLLFSFLLAPHSIPRLPRSFRLWIEPPRLPTAPLFRLLPAWLVRQLPARLVRQLPARLVRLLPGQARPPAACLARPPAACSARPPITCLARPPAAC